MSGPEIVSGFVPGSIGRITELHGAYYHEHWSFGLFFESQVATDLVEFMGRFDAERDGIWTASLGGRVEGSVAIDSSRVDTKGAHLRWFIVSDALRGQGIGSRLINAAIDSCRARGYPLVYLWTFEGLDAARHLYEKAGFVISDQRRGTQWGIEVNEQCFEMRLNSYAFDSSGLVRVSTTAELATRLLYGAGLVATACCARRWNSSPRAPGLRRLNRNVNSSR